MGLEEAAIQRCREAFATVDTDNHGTIDRGKVKSLLQALEEKPTEEELFRFMADIDEDGGGRIGFPEFLRAFENFGKSSALEEERDTIDAWVALGGRPDRSGLLDNEKLVKIVKNDFGLTIDIQTLVEELDLNKDGQIDYKEFAALFK